MNLKEMQEKLPKILDDLRALAWSIDIKSLQFTGNFIVAVCETQVWIYSFESEEWE